MSSSAWTAQLGPPDKYVCVCACQVIYGLHSQKLKPVWVGHFIDTYTLWIQKHTLPWLTHIPSLEGCTGSRDNPEDWSGLLRGISESTSLPFTTTVNPPSLKAFPNSSLLLHLSLHLTAPLSLCNLYVTATPSSHPEEERNYCIATVNLNRSLYVCHYINNS